MVDEDLGLWVEGHACDRRAVPSDSAAYASNWRRVLLVDVLVGLVPIAIGLVLRNALGAVVVVGGLVYLGLIGRRCVRWRRLRTAAGLDQ